MTKRIRYVIISGVSANKIMPSTPDWAAARDSPVIVNAKAKLQSQCMQTPRPGSVRAGAATVVGWAAVVVNHTSNVQCTVHRIILATLLPLHNTSIQSVAVVAHMADTYYILLSLKAGNVAPYYQAYYQRTFSAPVEKQLQG
jgi:hypothetical protein